MRLLAVLTLLSVSLVTAGDKPVQPAVRPAEPDRSVIIGGPDVLVRGGTIVATAVDYEMDGTMWVAATTLADSIIWLYRSVDHGLTWQFEVGLRGGYLPSELGLVVGEGDSAFVYVFSVEPGIDCVRLDRYNPITRNVICTSVISADSIREFTVCRDYSGGNYWLYAAVTTEVPAPNSRAVCFLRSTNYGRWWTLTDSSDIEFEDPYISAGAGTHIYFTGYAPEYWGGAVVAWTNRLWLDPGYWRTTAFLDTERIRNPAIAAAFTLPESLAMAWLVYSQDYRNSGDWDILYSYTWGTYSWSDEIYLASAADADEGYPDLRNFTSPSNAYVNVSYISEAGPSRRAYRRHVHASNPTAWSDTLRMNTGDAGTGPEVRPRLCYSPGSTFTGAGCVFVGAGRTRRGNSPAMSGRAIGFCSTIPGSGRTQGTRAGLSSRNPTSLR